MAQNRQSIKGPIPRYVRKGECNHCGWCCLAEDPPCPYLEKRSDKYFCSVFGKSERYIRCTRFPELPPITHEGCGYYFIDTWNNNKRLKVYEV